MVDGGDSVVIRKNILRFKPITTPCVSRCHRGSCADVMELELHRRCHMLRKVTVVALVRFHASDIDSSGV